MRADATGHATEPFPASPFASTAALEDGSWRFVSVDGTVYRAASALGALSVIAALPFRVEPVRAVERAVSQGIHSVGALAVIDTMLRAWVIDASGAPRALPLDRVLSVCFSSPLDALAVTEPGVLRVSRDGGASFEVMRPPAGVPIATWIADDGPRVRTTAGSFRYARGALAPVEDDGGATGLSTLAPEARRQADEGLTRVFDDVRRVALDRDRRATISGDTLVVTNARTGAELSRGELPGDGCELHRGFHGLRAVCRRSAWARVVVSREADREGWSVLRDETSAEPMGPVVFDDASYAWAVHAPCAQAPVIDPRDVCLYDARGARRTIRLPIDADLIAMHDGIAYALGVATGDVAPSLVEVRAEGAEVVSLPEEARAPVSVFVDARGRSVVFARNGGGLSIARSRARRGAASWAITALPTGYERALFRDDGTLFAWGSDARWIGRVRPFASSFEADPPLVVGARSLVALDLDARAHCVGSTCRFGGIIEAREGPGGPAPILTRDDAVTDAQTSAGTQRVIRCEHGAVTPAPEIDRGVAASGYAVQAALTAGSLSVTWSGATLAGAVSRPFAARAGARVFPRGVEGARAPAALLEVCAATGCDHIFATRTGLTDLGLGRAQPGSVEVQLGAHGFVARADTLREGVSLVTLIALDAAGAITARRTYALATQREHAHVGSWQGVDGLWIEDRESRMRFVALDPSDAAGRAVATVPSAGAATGSCGANVIARGEVRMLEGVAQAQGPGWFVEAGEWQQEEVLAVDEGSVCVRSLTGGEAHDEAEARVGGREEREPVRSLALRSDGADGLVGTAWSGRRAIALRCTRE